MSAMILTLPVLSKFETKSIVQIVLSERDISRLSKCADSWNCSLNEAASMILIRELTPPRRT